MAIAGCGSSSHKATSSSATSSASNRYPATTENAFLVSCNRAATAHVSATVAQSYCQTTLRCLEQRMTFAQFRTTEQAQISGRANPGMQTVLACAAVAGRATGVQVRPLG